MLVQPLPGIGENRVVHIKTHEENRTFLGGLQFLDLGHPWAIPHQIKILGDFGPNAPTSAVLVQFSKHAKAQL